MRSSSLLKEGRSRVEQPTSRGDGRHCSLCWTGICGTQPRVDQLATPEGVACHRALPHRCAGWASRPLHRLRTYDQSLLQLLPKQSLPTVPGQRAPALAPCTRAGTAAHTLRPCRRLDRTPPRFGIIQAKFLGSASTTHYAEHCRFCSIHITDLVISSPLTQSVVDCSVVVRRVPSRTVITIGWGGATETAAGVISVNV
jgi:hypothetical protein